MSIQIVNIKRLEGSRYDVYIGRRNRWLKLPGSKWGNPFHLRREADRPEVLRKYRKHILRSPLLLASLKELDGKVLGCYCRPKPCHGDVLAVLREGQLRGLHRAPWWAETLHYVGLAPAILKADLWLAEFAHMIKVENR